MFSRAIVRPPGANFVAGLSTAGEGPPDIRTALDQHQHYVEALRRCGLKVKSAPADLNYPDSTFVEDTAVIAGRMAVVTRPGAASRLGESAATAQLLQDYALELHHIEAPGTVDGGDICEAGQHFFIGLSNRTNAEGARQLAGIVTTYGYTSSTLDIRGNRSLLHLKSGLTWLGDDRMIVVPDLPVDAHLERYELLPVAPGEEYAANCVRVNDYVLVAAGYPQLAATLERLGYAPLLLDVSEFRKMDGGLSCLSLRF